MPPPEVSLVLIRTGAEAIIRALGRKRGERFLREWLAILATEDSVSQILPIRPPADRADVMMARRGAVAWLRQVAPTLIAAMSGD